MTIGRSNRRIGIPPAWRATSSLSAFIRPTASRTPKRKLIGMVNMMTCGRVIRSTLPASANGRPRTSTCSMRL